MDNFSKTIKLAAEGKLFSDYKTALQESLPPGTQGRLKYVVTREEGPDHDKSFFVDAVFGDRVLASGMGKSKKEAENSAAKSALEKGVF